MISDRPTKRPAARARRSARGPPAARPAPAPEPPDRRDRRPRRAELLRRPPRRRAAAPRRGGAGARPARPRRPPAPLAAPAPGTEAVTSPIVRRLIAEHGLDLAQITGTGEGGRITRNDVLAAGPADRARPARADPASGSAPAAPAAGASHPPAAAPPALRPAGTGAAAGDEVVPFDNIRRRTAEHMVRSKATSAHVYTSVRGRLRAHRACPPRTSDEWKDAEGFSLTYLPFIVRAFSDVVHDYPHVNASVDGDRPRRPPRRQPRHRGRPRVQGLIAPGDQATPTASGCG